MNRGTSGPGSLTAARPAVRGAARAEREARALPRLDLRLLKWLGIAVPLLFLGAAEGARGVLFAHHLDTTASRVFYFAVIAVGVAVFSQVVFAVIDRLENRIVHQNEYLGALNGIATLASGSPGLDDLLHVSLDRVLAALRVEAGLICSVDLARGEHSAVASRGFSDELVRSLQRSRIEDDPVATEVVETGCPVVARHLLDDPRVADVALREGVGSVISVPLKAHGDIIGIMAVASRTDRGFSEAEREFLVSVAGQLGVALHRAAAFERSLQRNREMEALLTISAAVTSSLDLPRVLDRALETILEATSVDGGEIWLADEDGLRLTRSRGAVLGPLDEAARPHSGEDLAGRAFDSRAPVLVHDDGTDGPAVRSGLRQAGFATYCALPLIHKDEEVGVLALTAREVTAVTGHDEMRLLTAVGEVMSVAIANARLYEQVQDTAVLEERERIAREMHDGLAQVLAYVNAQCLAIGTLMATDRPEAARGELAKLEDAVRDVYADVREAILGLRSSSGSAGEFFPGLQRYLDAYSGMTGTLTRLDVADDVARARLPSSSEIQLMRIIQEALANVRKHARARVATVSFECGGGLLRVRIEDDGRGFDPDRLPPRGWPRFGLQTMRERAEAIGGSFRIVSLPGRGTSVMVELSAAADAGPV